MHEPRPAGAELVDTGFLQLGLEVREGAEGRGDRLAQRTRGLTGWVGSRRRHALPEQRVVVVATAVVFDGSLLIAEAVEVLQDLLNGPLGPLGALKGGVGLVHIGLVVLVVVEFHRRLVDVRLERVIGVGKRGNGKGHGGLLVGV